MRRALRVEGTVQGVGFRPYLHRLAAELELTGFVGNDERGVFAEVEGAAEGVDAFLARLRAEAPPLAVVEAVEIRAIAPTGASGFAIVASEHHGAAAAPVTADAATCDDCLSELRDPADRRYGYAFLNCTNCGPRFTIVTGVPYDRPNTTMAGFAMCEACRTEYEDPADRRFHAQPVACPDCGPRLSMPAAEAVSLLESGAILAVKGLGGYHLACRADDEEVVARLRARKHREDRPFALMAPDLGTALALADLDAELLTSAARPIVLGERRPEAAVAPSVAPGVAELGVMLPYAPLHHLLVRRTLVMTSGNVADEPIAFRDDDARERLACIADAFVAHDRPIHTRTDDSVVRPGAVLRRSRGYVPGSLAIAGGPPVLAVGAELKNTFCVAKHGRAWVSHHIGDLRNAETLGAFAEGIEHFERLFAVTPEVVAHDLHPDYLSTSYALAREGVELVGVQHHHAHLAAVLAEHGIAPTHPAVGAIYDGAGHGSDGTVWGGEILVGDLQGFERVAHLQQVRLPGGDAAARQPWRMACAWMVAAGLETPEEWAPVARMCGTGLMAPWTSSVGRLFDAVAALCGIRQECTYEGQAAIELEALADRTERGAYAMDGLDPRQMIEAVLADRDDPGVVSARFHRGLAEATAAACAATGCELSVLSGGVFQNRLLLSLTRSALEARGLRVLVARRLPANDGGVSYGQAAVAAATS